MSDDIRFWFCVPNTVRVNADGSSTPAQIPAFLLDGRVQGIVNQEHAERVVRRILNPLDDPSLTVFPCVAPAENVIGRNEALTLARATARDEMRAMLARMWFAAQPDT